MNPKNERVLKLALALAEVDDKTFENIWSQVFGLKTEWQRLVAGTRICETVGQIEVHLTIEQNPTASGVLEVVCPKGKLGHKAFEALLHQYQPVGPGSALLYIAANQVDSKLVITSAWDNPADGHAYVAVYDHESNVLYPELISDLDKSHVFLVRRLLTSAK